MFYFFDGTKNGFLTAMVAAFHDESAVLTSKKIQLTLGESSVFVPTDDKKAARTEARLQEIDRHCLWELDTLLRCGEIDNEQTAFLYLRAVAKAGRAIRNKLALSEVFKAKEYIQKVSFEIHRLHGFIRFMQTESGALYAPFSPDNDVCDLLLPHFCARLPHYPFVLHDVKRKKAAVYDGVRRFVAPLHNADVLLSEKETAIQSLFKEYYDSVNIPERARPKQMRAYMPKRYWKFLTEKQ